MKNYDSVANPEDIPTKSYVDNVVFVGNTQPTGSEFWVDTGTADPTGPAGGNALDQATTDARYVQLGGSTMTGPLIQSADPATALATSTKQYTDTKIAKAGDTMTGPLVLAADPAAAMQPATRQYADARTGVRNRIINGDFSINQRGFTSTTVSGTFGFDRWSITCNGGTVTYSAGASAMGELPESARSYMRIVSAGQSAAGDIAIASHKMEGVRTLSGKTVVVSFWARAASGTPKVAVEFEQFFGTGGSPSATLQTYGGQATLSTTWTRYYLSVAVPSVVGKTAGTAGDDFLRLYLWTSAGSTYASRTGSMGTQNATIDFWGVQVEEGVYPSAYEQKSPQMELAACQRYFWRVGQFTSGSSQFTGTWFRFSTGVARAGNVIDSTLPFPVPMRIVPTITYTAASTFAVWNGSGSYACSAIGNGDCISNVSANIFATSTASGAAQATAWMFLVNAGAAGYIDFSAEL